MDLNYLSKVDCCDCQKNDSEKKDDGADKPKDDGANKPYEKVITTGQQVTKLYNATVRWYNLQNVIQDVQAGKTFKYKLTGTPSDCNK